MLAVAAMTLANFFDRCALGERVDASDELAAELVAATALRKATLLIRGEAP
jgi:hypothetical protein